jgi:putative flippase GtrA
MNSEIVRYIVNGVVATLVHYTILLISIEIMRVDSAGVANFISAIFGITVSFIGSRFFVFRSYKNKFGNQIKLFLLVYISIALMHGLILYWWSDVQQMDYRIGFIVATGLQTLLSYLGNKKLVFK